LALGKRKKRDIEGGKKKRGGKGKNGGGKSFDLSEISTKTQGRREGDAKKGGFERQPKPSAKENTT